MVTCPEGYSYAHYYVKDPGAASAVNIRFDYIGSDPEYLPLKAMEKSESFHVGNNHFTVIGSGEGTKGYIKGEVRCTKTQRNFNH